MGKGSLSGGQNYQVGEWRQGSSATHTVQGIGIYAHMRRLAKTFAPVVAGVQACVMPAAAISRLMRDRHATCVSLMCIPVLPMRV